MVRCAGRVLGPLARVVREEEGGLSARQLVAQDGGSYGKGDELYRKQKPDMVHENKYK